MARPCDPPALRRVGRRSRRSGSAAPPSARARAQVPPALPAWRRAVPRPGESSCALPLSFESSIGHQQLLHSDLLVVERDRNLEIAPGADQSLNGTAAETTVPHPLALYVPRGVLRCLFGRTVGRPDGRTVG